MTEWLDIVDESDRVVGRARREDCHGDPSLVHRVVHILVVNGADELLLQLRGKNKRIQPDKWDTSVGGHLEEGEGYEEGAVRELREELGLEGATFKPIYDYIWRTDIETERVRTYLMILDGPFRIQEGEIQEARFWNVAAILANLGKGIFTPNFEEEWRRYLLWKKQQAEEEA